MRQEEIAAVLGARDAISAVFRNEDGGSNPQGGQEGSAVNIKVCNLLCHATKNVRQTAWLEKGFFQIGEFRKR